RDLAAAAGAGRDLAAGGDAADAADLAADRAAAAAGDPADAATAADVSGVGGVGGVGVDIGQRWVTDAADRDRELGAAVDAGGGEAPGAPAGIPDRPRADRRAVRGRSRGGPRGRPAVNASGASSSGAASSGAAAAAPGLDLDPAPDAAAAAQGGQAA